MAGVDFSESLSSMDTEPSTTYKRAFWIGRHMIWPRRVLLNAGTWSAEKKSEYDAAWEVQKQAILKGLALQTDESVRLEKEKYGQAAPNYTDITFDAYFPIAELSAKIQYQTGLVMGLENGRDRNEGMLQQAKHTIKRMESELIDMQEDFVTKYPEHLQRNNHHIFIGRVQNDAKTVGQKRHLEEIEHVQSESVDFWEESMLYIGSEMLLCDEGF